MARIKNHWQNEELDKLQEAMDYTAVLSPEFKQRILGYIHFFGTNAHDYKEDALDLIKELKVDMERVSIFSDKFVTFVTINLEFGLTREIAKRENTKKNETK